jgi:hypothetical protein
MHTQALKRTARTEAIISSEGSPNCDRILLLLLKIGCYMSSVSFLEGKSSRAQRKRQQKKKKKSPNHNRTQTPAYTQQKPSSAKNLSVRTASHQPPLPPPYVAFAFLSQLHRLHRTFSLRTHHKK